MNILIYLQNEFNLKKNYVENIINLMDEGNTIPFIARYRKELTGSINDQILREFYEKLIYIRNLNEKRNYIKERIDLQGNLTSEILKSLEEAKTITELDDIYRPFRPKRITRAIIAKEKGLEPLALLIWKQNIDKNIDEICKNYIDKEKEIYNISDVLKGVKDIISEIISDDSSIRYIIRKKMMEIGCLVSKAKNKDISSVYDTYYDFKQSINKIPDHRILAINRGEKEGFLNVKINIDEEIIYNIIYLKISKQNKYVDFFLKEVIKDSYKRLIASSIEREIRTNLTEKSQKSSIKLFAENLRQLLLQSPVKNKIVLAIDPGFRTGCKLAVIDDMGKVLKIGVIYPTQPHNKIVESEEILFDIIKNYDVNIIAIGNGTASREIEIFIVDLLKNIDKEISYIIVNEAGASVYSASKIAADEFPDYDVSLRSAISIGRRLQDPLAELVKIDPKSIGVGQYQHDINQKKLDETLRGVVESCVNNVGVDLNTASSSLLSYVSGITTSVAKNILDYRNKNGKFRRRKELLKVKKLGLKVYEQCAGFLRIDINDGDNPLDSTGVHPESYKVVENILGILGYTLEDVKNNNIKELKNKIFDYENFAKKLFIGVPTLKDILKELEKPGRDIREDMSSDILRKDVLCMEDLRKGMVLKGIVRNVIDFGAFIDIGVHQDGLVHISKICDKYIKHPLDIISVGDIVNVKVIDVDYCKRRISLTMRDIL